MLTLTRESLNKIFLNLAQGLDIPDAYFEQARLRYQSIGNWLEREGSIVSAYAPEIYPQGSFALGTVIKPISNADEYDIDLVCRLGLTKADVTQKRLKELIGLELVDYVSAHSMNNEPEERRRCWAINYAEGARFHLDVLPSIPECMHQKSNEIAITDNQRLDYALISDDWVCCNPIDYVDWFKEQMKVQLYINRMMFAEAIKANVEDVPEYKVKTPLQRAIQILKRHRDMTYRGHPDDKPVSILITTLAARAYDNEADTLEGLVNIVTRMLNFIEEKDGVLWVENPVNQSENFADKWQEYPQRQTEFFNWLKRAEADILEMVNTTDFNVATKSLKRQFGEMSINEALKDVIQPSGVLSATSSTPSLIIGTSDMERQQRPVLNIKKPDKPWGLSK